MNSLKLLVQVSEKYLSTTVLIDGTRVKWGFVDVFQFFDNLAFNIECSKKQRQFNSITQTSDFEPFTCSCGIAACAGIYNGIRTKYRKNTVEWRSNPNDGYVFLFI